MIPDQDVERVREAADIVAIISEHVRLKKVGSVYRGPCPFHQGTNNNFSVMPRGGYTCFVCGEKGNVFTFVQKRLGMTFVEAVKYVGEKCGIEVREVKREREGPDPREPFWEINGTVAAWFSEQLWGELGAEARAYLESRRVPRATAEQFGLGFAPAEFGVLRNYLNGLGWDDARLVTAGILVQRDETEEPRSRFRNRLMFPILDVQSHVVGFGGRLMGPGEPKYLNSAESDVFHKGQTLYHLHAARQAMRREERAILVEGYMDVIRMAEAGLTEVVAPLGTALTEGQAELLRRHAKTVFIAYDSDAPGQKATFRAADALLAQGVAVRVVTMPEGDDPDTYVRDHGREGMEKLIAQSLDVFDRKVQLLERGGWFADLQRKRRAIDALLPTIRACADPLTRDMYLARAAEAAGVDRGVLGRELDAGHGKRGAGLGQGNRGAGARQGGAVGHDVQTGAGAAYEDEYAPPPDMPRMLSGPYKSSVETSSSERELVRLMLQHRALADAIIEGIGRLSEEELERPDFVPDRGVEDSAGLRDEAYRAIHDALLDADPSIDGPALLQWLAERLEPWMVQVAEQLVEEPVAAQDAHALMDGALGQLRMRALRQRLAMSDSLIPLAEGEEKDRKFEEKYRTQLESTRLPDNRNWAMLKKGKKRGSN